MINDSQVATAIQLANTYSNVATVSVGNETSFFAAFMPLDCLEGYIAGKLFAKIGRAVTGELTRESFITTMQQTGTFDLGGIVLQFGPEDHQGLDDTHLTTIYPVIVDLDPKTPGSD